MGKERIRPIMIEILDPILKPFGFKRKGYRWYRVLNDKVVQMIRRQPGHSMWVLDMDLHAVHTSMGVSVKKAGDGYPNGVDVFVAPLDRVSQRNGNYGLVSLYGGNEAVLYKSVRIVANDLMHYGIPYLDTITSADDFLSPPNGVGRFQKKKYGWIAKANVQMYIGECDKTEKQLCDAVDQNNKFIEYAINTLKKGYEAYYMIQKRELTFPKVKVDYDAYIKEWEKEWKKDWNALEEDMRDAEQENGKYEELIKILHSREDTRQYLDKQEAYTKASVKEYLKIDMDAMK